MARQPLTPRVFPAADPTRIRVVDPGIGASLSRLVAIIPVGSLEGAKSRLGESLDPEERQTLVTDLLVRTIRAAVAAPGVSSVVVVSPDPAVLDIATASGAVALRQARTGLNEGLGEAAAHAAREGAGAVLVIASDLPAVSTANLNTLIEEAADADGRSARGLVEIVPDRHGRGTNALLVSPPNLISFAFGPNSRAAHLAAARTAGATVLETDSPLRLDLDVPDDLLLAEQLGLIGPARGG